VSLGGRFPLWLRWFLSVLVAVVALILVVRFVQNHNSDANASQSPSAFARATRESTIIVEQDQAPHIAKLKPGVRPAVAIARAVRGDIEHSVNQGFINGPIQSSRCTALAPAGKTLRFRCSVQAQNISYPFAGVVDVSAGRITYCKRDPPPVPSQNIPVSRRCTH
jgi:hypothetical protein